MYKANPNALKIFQMLRKTLLKYGCHGSLIRYVKLRVTHAPGMSVTFSPSPQVSDHDMHHGTCVTHVLWCMPGSLTSGFLWWRENSGEKNIPGACATRFFFVSGKRPIPFMDIGCKYILVNNWVLPRNCAFHVQKCVIAKIRISSACHFHPAKPTTRTIISEDLGARSGHLGHG